KSRGVYETPAGTVLHEALDDLCRLVLPHDLLRTRAELGTRMADLIYNGQWFSPLRVALQAFVDSALEPASGEVTVELSHGARRAPLAPQAPPPPRPRLLRHARLRRRPRRGLHPPLRPPARHRGPQGGGEQLGAVEPAGRPPHGRAARGAGQKEVACPLTKPVTTSGAGASRASCIPRPGRSTTPSRSIGASGPRAWR